MTLFLTHNSGICGIALFMKTLDVFVQDALIALQKQLHILNINAI